MVLGDRRLKTREISDIVKIWTEMRNPHFACMFGHEKDASNMNAAFAHNRSKTMTCDCVSAMFENNSQKYGLDLTNAFQKRQTRFYQPVRSWPRFFGIRAS